MNFRPLHKRAVIRREEQTLPSGLVVIEGKTMFPKAVEFGRVENAGTRDDIAAGDRVVFTTMHATEVPDDAGAFVVPEDSVFAVLER